MIFNDGASGAVYESLREIFIARNNARRTIQIGFIFAGKTGASQSRKLGV